MVGPTVRTPENENNPYRQNRFAKKPLTDESDWRRIDFNQILQGFDIYKKLPRDNTLPNHMQRTSSNEGGQYQGHHIYSHADASRNELYKLMNAYSLDYDHNSLDSNIIPLSADAKEVGKTGSGRHTSNTKEYGLMMRHLVDAQLKSLWNQYDDLKGKSAIQIQRELNSLPANSKTWSKRQRDLALDFHNFSRQSAAHMRGLNAVIAARLYDPSSEVTTGSAAKDGSNDGPDVDQRRIAMNRINIEEIQNTNIYKAHAELNLKIRIGTTIDATNAGNNILNPDDPSFDSDDRRNVEARLNKELGKILADQDLREQYRGQQVDFDGRELTIVGPIGHFSLREDAKKRANIMSAGVKAGLKSGTVGVAFGLIVYTQIKDLLEHKKQQARQAGEPEPTYEDVMVELGFDPDILSWSTLRDIVKDQAIDKGLGMAARFIPFVGQALMIYDLAETIVNIPKSYHAVKDLLSNFARAYAGHDNAEYYLGALNFLQSIESAIRDAMRATGVAFDATNNAPLWQLASLDGGGSPISQGLDGIRGLKAAKGGDIFTAEDWQRWQKNEENGISNLEEAVGLIVARFPRIDVARVRRLLENFYRTQKNPMAIISQYEGDFWDDMIYGDPNSGRHRLMVDLDGDGTRETRVTDYRGRLIDIYQDNPTRLIPLSPGVRNVVTAVARCDRT